MRKTFSEKAIAYFLNLNSPKNLPEGISVLNPYADENVKKLVTVFFRKFFNDKQKRIIIFGINPGRFGGGTTGISFTDPVALQEFCGIENSLRKRRELSSEFVYQVIERYGGAEKFYSKFFLSAVYPLAIIKDGKNHNYYDSHELFEFLKPYLIASIKEQSAFGAITKVAISFGKKNADYLKRLNAELGIFEKIVYLDHPRFIMQYRRKALEDYIKKYLDVFNEAEQ